jgi:hypothetical protein
MNKECMSGKIRAILFDLTILSNDAYPYFLSFHNSPTVTVTVLYTCPTDTIHYET